MMNVMIVIGGFSLGVALASLAWWELRYHQRPWLTVEAQIKGSLHQKNQRVTVCPLNEDSHWVLSRKDRLTLPQDAVVNFHRSNGDCVSIYMPDHPRRRTERCMSGVVYAHPRSISS